MPDASKDYQFLPPWNSIGEKAAECEIELKAEVPKGHPLFGKVCQAIGIRMNGYTVLYAVNDTKSPYAVVDLSWSGKKEPRGLPNTTQFENWDEVESEIEMDSELL